MKTHSHSPPLVPLSWGELLDKIAILQIKRERILDPSANANIVNELALLLELAQPIFDAANIKPLFFELSTANRRLWDVEDNIRQKEAEKCFDAEFIELARAVYQVNDDRAQLKRTINRALNSSLIEEKSYKPYR